MSTIETDEESFPLPRWTHHEDGSITIHLPEVFALSLADTLREWEAVGRWTEREDCQNWERSPIARENRRESIVYTSCLTEIKTRLGRREVNAYMKHAQSLNEVQTELLEASTEEATAHE